MSTSSEDDEIKTDKIKEFRNSDYSQWVNLLHSYKRFRNYRENEFESGYEEVYCLREGFYIRILKFNIIKRNTVGLTFAGKYLLFCFKVKGTNIIRASSGNELTLATATAAIYYVDQDEEFEDLSEGDTEYLTVMLVVDPKIITQYPFLCRSDNCPVLLRPALNKESTRIEFSYTFGPDMLNAATALVERRVTGEHERTYLECKSTELLCMLFQDLVLLEAKTHLKHFSQSDLLALQTIKSRIDDSLKDLPAIPEMAKKYDIPESRLKTGFKSLYGLTLSGYIMGLRMQKAQQSLIERKLNIDRIAWELGYHHTSSFITAFKAHFGMTPKFYQRHLTSALSGEAASPKS